MTTDRQTTMFEQTLERQIRGLCAETSALIEWIPHGVAGWFISTDTAAELVCAETGCDETDCDETARTMIRREGRSWEGDALCDQHLNDRDALNRMLYDMENHRG